MEEARKRFYVSTFHNHNVLYCSSLCGDPYTRTYENSDVQMLNNTVVSWFRCFTVSVRDCRSWMLFVRSFACFFIRSFFVPRSVFPVIQKTPHTVFVVSNKHMHKCRLRLLQSSVDGCRLCTSYLRRCLLYLKHVLSVFVIIALRLFPEHKMISCFKLLETAVQIQRLTEQISCICTRITAESKESQIPHAFIRTI